MTRVVIDTNVLIGDAPVVDASYQLAVSSVTYAELETGARLATTGSERAQRVRRLALARATYGPGLPFDDRAATSFGMLAELVKATGRTYRARTADLMIAATAHAHGAAVLTYNTDYYRGLEDAVSVLDAGGGHNR